MANKLAHHLLRIKGVKIGQVVPLMFEKSTGVCSDPVRHQQGRRRLCDARPVASVEGQAGASRCHRGRVCRCYPAHKARFEEYRVDRIVVDGAAFFNSLPDLGRVDVGPAECTSRVRLL